MAGTKQFITASVGVKGKNNKNDVLALQQLLVAAGENVIGGADGGWGEPGVIWILPGGLPA